jgi:glycopeptide antibiotics resistance protein
MSPPSRTGYLVAALLYALLLAVLLVAPIGGVPHQREYLSLGFTGSPRRLVADLIVNVALFVPLGALLSRWAATTPGPPLWRACAIVIGAALFATFFESLQYILPRRYSSLRDVIANAAGAGCGIVAERWVTRRSAS